MKIGELLISRNMLKPEQLQEALQSQLIYGGHLGTCLIEKGYLTEAQLGKVLAETFGVKYAPKKAFHDIPRSVIAALPAAVVEKHSVVPIRLGRQTLHIAMIDPTNLLALDEARFVAGRRLQAWIAPEARVYQAMERYYDIPRRQRYIMLCRQLDGGDSMELEHAGVTTRIEITPGTAPQSSARSAPALARDIAPAPREDAPGAPPTPATETTLDQTTELLCRAESQAALAQIVLRHASQGLARSMLFGIAKDQTAAVWKTDGIDLDHAVKKRMESQLGAQPLFGLLLGGDHYRGPLPAESRFREIYGTMGIDPPAELLLLPVHVNDKLVALFYGDGGSRGVVQGETGEYRRLMRKLALALSLLAVKRRLRSA